MQINFLDQLSDKEYENTFGKHKTDIGHKIFNEIEKHDDDLNDILARDIKFSLSGDMLVKVDRFSMKHSLEVRSPFLDKDLAEYAFSIPGNKKVGLFSGKKILRDTFFNFFQK